jgi:prostamide/prostaglandin F2alpha synthase
MGALDMTTSIAESSDEIKNKLKHVAVGLAKLDYEDFLKENYFQNGHIYIDEGKQTYKALDFTSKGIFSLYGMLNVGLYTKGYQASKRGIKGNMKGDGFQLGGTLIVDRKGDIIFKHLQKSYSDQPDMEQIFKAVRNYSLENDNESKIYNTKTQEKGTKI